MEEKITAREDIMTNISVTSQNLVDSKSGSDERLTEAKIYDMQHKLNLETDKLDLQEIMDNRKLEFEKEKFEAEMKFKREFEERRIAIEESKANTEKMTLWTRAGIAGLEMISGIGLGILYLKANMKYGGMIGKDGKKWFDDLRRIKL